MKSFLNKLIIIIFSFLFLIVNVQALDFEINSKNAILINLNDDNVLYEKDANNKVLIASLTKVMTAVVAIENIDNLETEVNLETSDFNKVIQENLSIADFSLNKNYTYVEAKVKSSENYTYKDLLYGLLLPSGAECAQALARLIGKTEENFVKMMNEKAQDLKMLNTHFSNPIGLDDNNYSTVNDLAILFKYAIKNETLKEILTTPHYQTKNNEKVDSTIYYYEDKYNLDMPYLKGGKTGFTELSGYSLFSLAEYNDIKYLLITINADDRPKHLIDAKNIYEYYMNNYNYQTVIKENTPLVEINTLYTKDKNLTITATKDYKYYLRNDFNTDLIKTEYQGVKTISPETRKNSKLGILNIYYDDELLDTIDITLNKDLHYDLIAYILKHKIIVVSIASFLISILLIWLISIKNKQKKLKKGN